jgi:hypothetical protein
VRDRNRALHGDTVIVEILPQSQWIVHHEAVQDFLQMRGTEADHQVLHQRAIFNIKQEQDPTATMSTMSSVAVHVEIDTYRSPAPRLPDTVTLLTSSTPPAAVDGVIAEAGAAAADSDCWGPGNVGTGAWDTTGVQLNSLANQVLTAVVESELAAAKLTVEETAVDLPLAQRVPVERSGPGVLPPDLVIPVAAQPAQSEPMAALRVGSHAIGGVPTASYKTEEALLAEKSGLSHSLEELESDYESDDSLVDPDLDQRIEDEAFRHAKILRCQWRKFFSINGQLSRP